MNNGKNGSIDTMLNNNGPLSNNGLKTLHVNKDLRPNYIEMDIFRFR